MRRAAASAAIGLGAALLAGCSPLIGLVVRAAQGGASELRAGETVRGTTRGQPDAHQPSCGAPGGAGDRAYVFVPEATGVHTIEVEATYDSVVAVRDEAGEWIACNDDTERTNHSVVRPSLEAGRRYTIVVDGFRAATGSFSLRLDAPEPGPEPVPAQGALALGERREGDTRGRTDTRTPPCGAAPGSPDQTWRFVAPAAGRYVIDVDSADYDGVLAVYAPGAADPIECNDDHGSTRASRVVVELSAGQAIDVVVDGYRGAEGAYGVVVRALDADGPAPTSQELLLDTPARGDTRRGTDRFQPGCGSQPGARDEAWLFRPPETGAYRFHVDAEYDSVLAVYELGGTSPLLCNDDFGSTRASRLATRLERGRRYLVVVDGYARNEGAYTLTATAVVSGGGGALRVGELARGNTAGGADQHTPACGSRPGSPDERWTFTAPASGQYTFHVDADDFDSVLALYDAQGRELACNDDFGNLRASRVEVPLSAGDTVVVVVDGFQGASGSYQLRVAPAGALGPSPTPPLPPTPPPPPPVEVENMGAMETRCASAPALPEGLSAGRIVAATRAARTSCGSGTGGDAVYTVQVPAAATLTLRTESTLPIVLELRAGCSRGHTVVACETASNDPNRVALSARLEPGRTYTLVVASLRAGDATFALDATIAP